MEGILARWFADTNGSIVSTGTAPAYAVTTSRTFTAHVPGIRLAFRAHATFESGSATVIINGLAAKSLVRSGGFTLQPLDIVENQLLDIIRNEEFDAYECMGIFSKHTIGDPEDWWFATLPNSAWLWLNGQTISKAGSGGTARASDSVGTRLLFTKMWTDHSNTVAPIEDSTGTPTTRGASALDDWNAGKRLPLPDTCGRGTVGANNMGGVFSKNRLTGISGGLDGDVLRGTGGGESHTLSIAQLPVTDMDDYKTDTPHAHSYLSGTTTGNVQSGGGENVGDPPTGNTSGSSTTGITFATLGSGSAHNIVQPSIVCNKIIYAGAP